MWAKLVFCLIQVTRKHNKERLLFTIESPVWYLMVSYIARIHFGDFACIGYGLCAGDLGVQALGRPRALKLGLAVYP